MNRTIGGPAKASPSGMADLVPSVSTLTPTRPPPGAPPGLPPVASFAPTATYTHIVMANGDAPGGGGTGRPACACRTDVMLTTTYMYLNEVMVIYVAGS